MSKSIRRTVPLVLALVTLVGLPTIALANHTWGNYHWARTSNPFTLKAGDNVGTAWDAYLDEAIQDWSQSQVLNLAEVAGGINPKTCKALTGRMDVCNAKYGNNGWLGIAGISITGGTHITKGYVKLNDTYYSTATYNTPAWRRFVTCQEIGHILGLGHVNETFNDPNTGSCMDYTNDPDGGAGGVSSNDPSNEHPNAHDYAVLEQIYSHLDSTTTVGAAIPASRDGSGIVDQLDQNQRAAWGRLVAASQGHGVEVYELDLGGGRKQVTFVVWTLEAAAKRRAEHQFDHD
jgi:hypothetical protein